MLKHTIRRGEYYGCSEAQLANVQISPPSETGLMESFLCPCRHITDGDIVSLNSISTNDAPAAIGPYSQAIDSGSIVFCSGQIGLDPVTGKLISDDVEAQTTRCLANMEEVLKASGITRDQVAKTTIYLTNMDDFGKVNELYGAYFGTHRPARTTVSVVALPRGAKVEIEALAVKLR